MLTRAFAYAARRVSAAGVTTLVCPKPAIAQSHSSAITSSPVSTDVGIVGGYRDHSSTLPHSRYVHDLRQVPSSVETRFDARFLTRNGEERGARSSCRQNVQGLSPKGERLRTPKGRDA